MEPMVPVSSRSSMFKIRRLYPEVEASALNYRGSMYTLSNVIPDAAAIFVNGSTKEDVTYEGDDGSLREVIYKQEQLLSKLMLLSQQITALRATLPIAPEVVKRKQVISDTEAKGVNLPDTKKAENRKKAKMEPKTGLPIPAQAGDKHVAKARTAALRGPLPSNWDYTKDNVVIHANPKWPPYSLLALNCLFGDRLHLNISSYFHSSVKGDTPALLSSLEKNWPPSNGLALTVKLIWREMNKDCQLIMSPVKHKTILGEVNMLRFFDLVASAGDGPGQQDNEDLTEQILTVASLDLAHEFRHLEDRRRDLLKVLEGRLNGRRWLISNDKVSMGDAAVWSAINDYPTQSMPAVVASWHARCLKEFSR